MPSKHRNANKLVLGESVARVQWEDAWSSSMSYWSIDKAEVEPPLILQSVGFVIRNDTKGITLANDRPSITPKNDAQDFRYIHHIPRAMIRKVTKLL